MRKVKSDDDKWLRSARHACGPCDDVIILKNSKLVL